MSRRAFTLIELLVVIAIIGTLLALLLPAIQAVRGSARRVQCSSRLRQIGTALRSYHDDNGELPPGSHRHGRIQLAWNVRLLPYLEQDALHDEIDFDSPFVSKSNQQATSAVIPVFLCPSTSRIAWDRDGDRIRSPRDRDGPGRGATDYGGMFGSSFTEPLDNGVLIYDRPVRLAEVTDGLSHTIMVAEDTGRGYSWDGEWANGGNVFAIETTINERQNNEIWSDHPGGAQVLLCGGSVQFLSETIRLEVLIALCTRGGGDKTKEAGW
jgi:prepilin-type N-terminal cleavage/methylation domain-containing protein